VPLDLSFPIHLSPFLLKSNQIKSNSRAVGGREERTAEIGGGGDRMWLRKNSSTSLLSFSVTILQSKAGLTQECMFN
jgi:hypothetical protein